MKKEDIKFGEIYFCEKYSDKLNNDYICLYKESNSPYISATNNTLAIKNFGLGLFNDSNITREATPEEKHWLNTCIEQDKYVEYSDAMGSYIENILNPTPDYGLNEVLEKLLNTN